MGRRRQHELRELTLAEAHLHAQCDALDRRREFEALPPRSDEPRAEHHGADEGSRPPAPAAEDVEVVIDVAALEREQLFAAPPRPQRRRRRAGSR